LKNALGPDGRVTRGAGGIGPTSVSDLAREAGKIAVVISAYVGIEPREAETLE